MTETTIPEVHTEEANVQQIAIDSFTTIQFANEPESTVLSAPVVKEHATLSEKSLKLLESLLKENEKLQLAMRLCLPTSTIVRIKTAAEQMDESDISISLFQRYLLEWKRRNVSAKDKDKLEALEKCLRDMTKEELADAVRECATLEQELSADKIRKQN